MDVIFFLRRQLDYMSSFSSSADMHQVITFLINAKNVFNFRLGNFLNFIKNDPHHTLKKPISRNISSTS